jgi:hypothetical protein
MNTVIEAIGAPCLMEAALTYLEIGFSVIPLVGKQAAVPWTEYQTRRAPASRVHNWMERGILQNVGIVCGQVSDNLAVLDCDGQAAVHEFEENFPHLVGTLIVETGSGKGRHYYFQTRQYTHTTRCVGIPGVGNLELRSGGCYVVAPPSVHPDTQRPYVLSGDSEAYIMEIEDLCSVEQWIFDFIAAKKKALENGYPRAAVQFTSPAAGAPINPAVIDAIAAALMNKGYVVKHTWVFGECLFTERHKHQDLHPSFGFDTRTGRAHCFACGFLKTLDVCSRLGLDVNAYGGLWQK